MNPLMVLKLFIYNLFGRSASFKPDNAINIHMYVTSFEER